MRALLIGLAASLFFATTFLFNRVMDLAGGSWIWSAALRFFWMVPLMLILVMNFLMDVAFTGGAGMDKWRRAVTGDASLEAHAHQAQRLQGAAVGGLL